MDSLKIKNKIFEENKLPANIEAEQSLIGSVLVNNDIIDEISNIVNIFSNQFLNMILHYIT